MTKEFAGRNAIIVGGTRGIGFESALELARRGLSAVVITGRNIEEAKIKSRQIEELGCKVYLFQMDTSIVQDIESLFEYVNNKLNINIDILVYSAGICPMVPIEDETAEKWDLTMNTNLRGAHLCVRECMNLMKKQNYGKIILISSVDAKAGGTYSSPSYVASKGGLLSVAKSYAIALGKYNINVNVICPGVINTDMTKDADYSEMEKTLPLRRLGETEDIASVVCFLASDDSKYITGCSIDVNGGVFMQ